MTALLRRIQNARSSLPGWCSAEKAERLAFAVLEIQPRLCVEIGVFGGSSLVPQLLALQHLGRGRAVGIDPWETAAALEEMIDEENRRWWNDVDLAGVRRICESFIAENSLSDHCELVVGRAEDVADRFDRSSVDLLHIDGNHSQAKSVKDVELYLPKLRTGGLVFFDDVSWREAGITTTSRAVEILDASCDRAGMVSDCQIFVKR